MRKKTIGRLLTALVGASVVSALTLVASAAQAPVNRTPSLPPAVLKAFQQAYPGATISATWQERDADRDAFRVESIDKGRRRIVLYGDTGAVIEVAEQVDEKDLPQAVAAAMNSHPRAIYASGMKVTRGGSVQYQLTVRGTRKTAMIAKPDGTVVSFK
jgi:hypothetical protein